ncbi:uncharacterized protein LOC129919610 [Episyrphus balteatus]|uniref:uncharacterized protein LOC129919610 n=1 Tax=Episyrphus balteatus TaxID=286459 RepID=UPI0024854456|nr:uncharacterized protein LOC129919610 [Episyrphus balteatus]
MMTASIPPWINENHIIDVLEENLQGFKSINKFKSCIAGGAGENYQSVIVRVQINAELKDGSTKDVSFIIKTVPQIEQAAMMLAMMGHFPKENLMYSKYLPTFEKMYTEIGQEITFGPKHYTLKKNPESDYVLLDDLCLEGYKNQNRIEGLDKEHTEAALKKLAEFHAASAVHCQVNGGELEGPLVNGMFNDQMIGMFVAMMKPTLEIFLKSLEINEIDSKYIEKARAMIDVVMDKFIELNKPNLKDFNVICHGDLWSNNIMFLHDEVNGKLKETRFVDFQLSRYASPVIDLYYFLLTSPKLEIKVANFDEFIQFYHENLIKNLKLLNYSKKLPTLKDLHLDLLKKNFWGFSTLTNTCAGILLDPSDACNVEDFLKEGDAADQIKMKLYTNPKYVKQLKVILPWMDSRGLLDL